MSASPPETSTKALFASLAQARVALGCWRADYNGSRPHSQLGWKTPAEFAFTFHPRRDLALRYAKGSAPAPVAHTARQGNPNDLLPLNSAILNWNFPIMLRVEERGEFHEEVEVRRSAERRSPSF